MINGWHGRPQLTRHDVTPGLVVLDGLRKQAEQTKESKPVSSILCSLGFSPCLRVPTSSSYPCFSERWTGTWELEAERSPFLSKGFLVIELYHSCRNTNENSSCDVFESCQEFLLASHFSGSSFPFAFQGASQTNPVDLNLMLFTSASQLPSCCVLHPPVWAAQWDTVETSVFLALDFYMFIPHCLSFFIF